jgi:hypothetical protein
MITTVAALIPPPTDDETVPLRVHVVAAGVGPIGVEELPQAATKHARMMMPIASRVRMRQRNAGDLAVSPTDKRHYQSTCTGH